MNRCILVLQTIALPLGYCAVTILFTPEADYSGSDGEYNTIFHFFWQEIIQNFCCSAIG